MLFFNFVWLIYLMVFCNDLTISKSIDNGDNSDLFYENNYLPHSNKKLNKLKFKFKRHRYHLNDLESRYNEKNDKSAQEDTESSYIVENIGPSKYRTLNNHLNLSNLKEKVRGKNIKLADLAKYESTEGNNFYATTLKNVIKEIDISPNDYEDNDYGVLELGPLTLHDGRARRDAAHKRKNYRMKRRRRFKKKRAAQSTGTNFDIGDPTQKTIATSMDQESSSTPSFDITTDDNLSSIDNSFENTSGTNETTPDNTTTNNDLSSHCEKKSVQTTYYNDDDLNFTDVMSNTEINFDINNDNDEFCEIDHLLDQIKGKSSTNKVTNIFSTSYEMNPASVNAVASTGNKKVLASVLDRLDDMLNAVTTTTNVFQSSLNELEKIEITTHNILARSIKAENVEKKLIKKTKKKTKKKKKKIKEKPVMKMSTNKTLVNKVSSLINASSHNVAERDLKLTTANVEKILETTIGETCALGKTLDSEIRHIYKAAKEKIDQLKKGSMKQKCHGPISIKNQSTPRKFRTICNEKYNTITNSGTTNLEDDYVILKAYEDMLTKESEPSDTTLPTTSLTPKWKKKDITRKKRFRSEKSNSSEDVLNNANSTYYKDFVDGYKHYLNFERDLNLGDQHFSNQIKYQAHRHHDVDDIGKYILAKLPKTPIQRTRRKFDNIKNIPAPNSSWFDKHFYLFTDLQNQKKYHTSETVVLKLPTPDSKNHTTERSEKNPKTRSTHKEKTKYTTLPTTITTLINDEEVEDLPKTERSVNLKHLFGKLLTHGKSTNKMGKSQDIIDVNDKKMLYKRSYVRRKKPFKTSVDGEITESPFTSWTDSTSLEPFDENGNTWKQPEVERKKTTTKKRKHRLKDLFKLKKKDKFTGPSKHPKSRMTMRKRDVDGMHSFCPFRKLKELFVGKSKDNPDSNIEIFPHEKHYKPDKFFFMDVNELRQQIPNITMDMRSTAGGGFFGHFLEEIDPGPILSTTVVEDLFMHLGHNKLHTPIINITDDFESDSYFNSLDTPAVLNSTVFPDTESETSAIQRRPLIMHELNADRDLFSTNEKQLQDAFNRHVMDDNDQTTETVLDYKEEETTPITKNFKNQQGDNLDVTEPGMNMQNRPSDAKFHITVNIKRPYTNQYKLKVKDNDHYQMENYSDNLLKKQTPKRKPPYKKSATKIYPDYFSDLLWHGDIQEESKTDAAWQPVLSGLQSNDFFTPSYTILQRDITKYPKLKYSTGLYFLNRTVSLSKKHGITDNIRKFLTRSRIKESKDIPLPQLVPEVSNFKGNDKFNNIQIDETNTTTKCTKDQSKTTLDDLDTNAVKSNDKFMDTLKYTLKSTKKHSVLTSKFMAIKPYMKTTTTPLQFYTTPVPMVNSDFEKFLKDNDLDVKTVTSPLGFESGYVDTWSQKKATSGKLTLQKVVDAVNTKTTTLATATPKSDIEKYERDSRENIYIVDDLGDFIKKNIPEENFYYKRANSDSFERAADMGLDLGDNHIEITIIDIEGITKHTTPRSAPKTAKTRKLKFMYSTDGFHHNDVLYGIKFNQTVKTKSTRRLADSLNTRKISNISSIIPVYAPYAEGKYTLAMLPKVKKTKKVPYRIDQTNPIMECNTTQFLETTPEDKDYFTDFYDEVTALKAFVKHKDPKKWTNYYERTSPNFERVSPSPLVTQQEKQVPMLNMGGEPEFLYSDEADASYDSDF